MSGGRPKALIIDVERAIRRFLRSTLLAEGFEVLEAGSASEGLALARTARPDLVVLDLGLPDGDGATLIKPLAALDAPAILVLSALDNEARKVAALDEGADDFVAKPFGVPEFMARVRAALRHRLQKSGACAVYDDGRLSVDFVRRIVRINGADPRLTPREYAVLTELLNHAGKVLTHRHLIQKIWAEDPTGDVQALRVHIRHLRQKIEAQPESPVLVVTVPSVGYRFLPPNLA